MDGPEILNSVDQIEKLDKVARRTFRLEDNPLPAGFTLNVLNINSLEIDQDRRETRLDCARLNHRRKRSVQSFAISRCNHGAALAHKKTSMLRINGQEVAK
jgi:hypothetical protein